MEPPAKILILEDDEQLRLVLETVLKAEGYEVRAAPRAEEALRLAQEDPPDLTVADIRMEGMDGLDALAVMRERNPSMRSLVVTGYSTEADSIRAIRLGVGDYLKKPFDLSEFLESIQRILAARLEERVRQEQEAASRGAVLWALKALIDAWSQTRPSLKRLETIAESLSGRLGLSRESRETVLLACYYSVAREVGGARQASALTASLPVSLGQHLRGLDECWDGSGPLQLRGEQVSREARIASVILAASTCEPPESGLAQHLEASHPGRFDPEILVALQGGPAAADEVEATSGAHRRGLLSLARALEESRQSELAARTYQRLCESSIPSREAVEALCGLARLARGAGRPEAMADFYKRALARAEQLGPGLSAETALEAAVALSGQGSPQAAAWAERAGQWFSQTQNPGGQALALLVRHFMSPAESQRMVEACHTLGQTENSPLLTRHGWLLGMLLQRPAWLEQPESRRLMLRLMREQGPWVGAWWRSERAGLELRRQLAEPLCQHGMVAAVPALFEALSQDPDADIRRLVSALSPSADAPLQLLGLRLQSMGNFEAYRGCDKVADSAWKTQKVKYLLALLASRRGRPISEDVLIEEFWPGDADRGKQNLYWSTSVIRRALRGVSHDPIERVHSSLQINPALPRWHDLELLDDGLAEARQKLLSSPAVVDQPLLRRLLEFYRGPYLEGCYYDWAEGIRTRLARTATEVYESAAEKSMLEGKAADALEFARFLLDIDCCNQGAHLLVMRATLALGKTEDCIRHYDVCKRVLHRELGVEPNLNIFECFQRARLAV